MRAILLFVSLLLCVAAIAQEGGIVINSNIEPKIAAPIDGRTFLPTLADTANIDFVYNGMIVWVDALKKNYRKKDAASAWEEFEPGVGGVSDGNKTDITVSGDTWTLNSNVVGTSEIQDNSVTASKIATGAVGADELDAAAVASEYATQVPTVSQADAEAGTSTTVYRMTPERVRQAIEANSSPKWGTHMIASNGSEVDVSAMTDVQRGQALIDILGPLGVDSWLYLPPYKYEVPDGNLGIQPQRQSEIFGHSTRQAKIIGRTSHALYFANDRGAYRVSFTNISFETVRAEAGANWDAIHFEDRTGLDEAGAITFNNCHITEADRDGIHLTNGWRNILFKNQSTTDVFDIGRYMIYSDGQELQYIGYCRDANVYLDVNSEGSRIQLFTSTSAYDDELITDLGTNNSVFSVRDLNTRRQKIGGRMRLIQDHIRDPDRVVFYSPMDAASFNGRVLKDYSGSGNYAVSSSVATSPTIIYDAEMGECLDFDGVDDFMQLILGDHFTDGKFFASFLVKVDVDANMRIINGGLMDYSYKTTGSEFRTFFATGSGTRNATMEVGKWVHVGISLDGANYTVWTNGEQGSALVSTQTVLNAVVHQYLGCLAPGNNMMNGKLKHFLLYNGYYPGLELDAYQMAVSGKRMPFEAASVSDDALQFPTENIVYYNPMNDATAARDWGVNAIDGAINSAPVVETHEMGGKALNFDGVDDNIVIPHNAAFNSNDFAFSVLARIDASVTRRIAFKNGVFDLAIKVDGLDADIYVDGVPVKLEYNLTRPGAPVHIVFGHKGSNLFLYINGELWATATTAGTFNTSTDPIYIGSNATTSFWDGMIDEVVMLNDISDEIAEQLYRSAITNSLLLPQPPSFYDQPFRSGNAAPTTDGSGQFLIVHGLGATPTAVTVTNESGIPYFFDVSRGPTNIGVTVYDDTGVAVVSTAVAVSWVAYK